MKFKNLSTEQFDLKGLALVFIFMFALAFFLDINSLKETIKIAGIWAPALFVCLKALTIIIAPLGGSPLYPLVGLFFGFWPGILYVALGDLIGYTTSFYISRFFGQKAVERMISKNQNGLIPRMVLKMGTTKGFFQACLTCFPLPELLSYSAGLSRLEYWKFILILWPASTILASILVFSGTLFNFSNNPLILTILVPTVGVACVLIGGFFFLRGLKRED